MKRILVIVVWILSWGFPAWLILGPSKDPFQGFVMPALAAAAVLFLGLVTQRGRALATQRKKDPIFLEVISFTLLASVLIGGICFAFGHELVGRSIMAGPYIAWWLTRSICDVPDMWRWVSHKPNVMFIPNTNIRG